MKIIQSTIWKRASSFLSAILIGCMTIGCTAQPTEPLETQKSSAPDTIDYDDNTAKTDNTGMGRYVEKTVLETDTSNYSRLYFQEMDNNRIGMLYLTQTTVGCYVSEDNGDTWQLEPKDNLWTYVNENFMLASALSKDGTAALCYSPLLTDTRKEFEPHFVLSYADGTEQDLPFELPKEEKYAKGIAFDDTSERLFISPFGGKIYEVNPKDGSSKVVTTLDHSVLYMQVKGDLLLCVTSSVLYFYDLSEERFIEDATLQNFIDETYSGISLLTESGYNAIAFLGEKSGEDQVVYIAGPKGLYRHVVGGSSVEQIIDGNLSSLGDLSHNIETAIATQEQEFLVKYDDGKLVKFTYDPTISTVPDETIRVFSLTENDTIRQAISIYQTENPEMYVVYETGMSEEGVTREDALKKLNTQLLDGNGPDILILDNMPIDSYIDKKILMDISDVIHQIDQSDGLFVNLIEPFYRENALYMVPAEFNLPAIGGHKADFQNIDNYENIADVSETLRAQNPDSALFSIYSATGIMKKFVTICAPAWKTVDGTVDKNMIKEFLIQSKRIYDAQMNGVSDEFKDEYTRQNQENTEKNGVSYEDTPSFKQINGVDYIIGNTLFFSGAVSFATDYNTLNSIPKITGFEDTIWKPMNGQSHNVYVPSSLVGINASTNNRDKAILFLQTLLGMNVQKNTFYGFPMNKAAFDEHFVVDKDYIGENGEYLWMSLSSPDGIYFDYVLYIPTQEQLQQIKNWIEQSKTPYICDTILEEAVLTEGEKYLIGEVDLDTTVNHIMNIVQIYLSE